MKSIEENKEIFVAISKMMFEALESGEILEAYSINEYASAVASLLSQLKNLDVDDEMDELFYDIRERWLEEKVLLEYNHQVVLGVLMFTKMINDALKDQVDEYNKTITLEKLFKADNEKGWMVLDYIKQHPRCSQKEVSEHVKMTASNISHFISNYRDSELWYEEKSGRNKRLTITPKGERILEIVKKNNLEEFAPAEEKQRLLEEKIHLETEEKIRREYEVKLQTARDELWRQAFCSGVNFIRYINLKNMQSSDDFMSIGKHLFYNENFMYYSDNSVSKYA